MFSEHNRSITDEAVTLVLDWTERYTFYTQSLCHKLFAENSGVIDLDAVKTACTDILFLNEPIYLQIKELLTNSQWNYLIAVAKEGEVKAITSKDFLSKHGIASAAASRQLVKALREKELLIDNVSKNGVSYSVYDLFFAKWLALTY